MAGPDDEQVEAPSFLRGGPVTHNGGGGGGVLVFEGGIIAFPAWGWDPPFQTPASFPVARPAERPRRHPIRHRIPSFSRETWSVTLSLMKIGEISGAF
jgi:hypothetical protein